MSSNAFNQLVRDELRKDEQAEIARDERDRMNGIHRDGSTTQFLHTSESWGVSPSITFSFSSARFGVTHYRDVAPDVVVLSINYPPFNMQQSLSAADARRLANALLLAADAVEQA